MLAEIRSPHSPSAAAGSAAVAAPFGGLPAGTRRRARVYSDIERRAVAWVAGHLDFFDPAHFADPERAFTHKALVELGLLVACRARLDPTPLGRDHLAILDHVEKVAARGSYRDRVARDHRAFLLYALTYAALRVCGRDDPDYRAVVERAISARYPLVCERVPFRQLDLLHFLALADLEAPGLRADEVFPLTTLAGDPNIVEVEEIDAYAITHSLFYVTDFGLRAPAWPAAFDPARALDLVAALLRLYRVRDNADLAGELVISSLCLGVRRSAEMDRSWRYLRGKQEADGRVPGPPGVIDEAQAEAIGGAAYREWKTSYHTTLVVALAALMARRAELEPAYPAATMPPGARLRPGREPGARRTAVGDAVGWLCARLQEPDLSCALRAGAGVAIGLDSMGVETPQPAAAAALTALAARLEHVSPEQPLWTIAGADTLLWVACGFRRVGAASRRLERELDELAGGLDGEALAAAPAALSAGALLVRLGKLEPEVLAAAVRRAPPLASRPAAGETAAAFAARLIACRGGDPARRDGGETRWRRTTEWLSDELVSACREYRLDQAALIARALRLVGAGQDRVTQDALSYLASQQKPDGSFGYFARDAEPDAASAAVRLQWTLTALAALGEAEGV